MPRQRRQHRTVESLAKHLALFVYQDKEERLVLDDGAAGTRAKLIAVGVIFRNAVKIGEPVRRIQRRVVVAFKNAAVDLVGSRTRHHRHLSGTASGFGVHGRCDDLDFFHQVGTDIGVGKCAEIVAAEEKMLMLAVEGASRRLPAILSAVATGGGEVQETSLSQPSLESLFIKLTGRALRE